ncbi:PREDICTED: acid-sensing ion channel 1-like [Priapulus caudatus]|uniref:Acid-sensing ion channel 1-like n=1 Tax=Priapulus caudatus TaxID=37621 RepID=A0ABM1F286_PRICU|nr:PREDICTED: acid-sensing ion channel 1-like [Priapulus caudatus]
MSSKAEQTTLHGVHWVFDSRLPLLLRLGWIVAILSSWSYLLYLTYSRVTYLSTHPKKTIVDVKYDPGGLEFPAVTICNNNLVKRSTSHKLPQYEELERFLNDYTTYRWRHGLAAGENFPAADYNLSHLTMNELTALSEKDEGAGSVIGCHFDGRSCMGSLRHITRLYGHCYVFNSQVSVPKTQDHDGWDPRPPLYSSQTTSDHGLTMVLWADADEYFYGYKGDMVGFTVSISFVVK